MKDLEKSVKTLKEAFTFFYHKQYLKYKDFAARDMALVALCKLGGLRECMDAEESKQLFTQEEITMYNDVFEELTHWRPKGWEG